MTSELQLSQSESPQAAGLGLPQVQAGRERVNAFEERGSQHWQPKGPLKTKNLF